MKNQSIKLPVDWFESVPVMLAGNEVLGAFCRLEAWSMKNQTDGWIPGAVASMFMPQRLMDKALKFGLLEAADDGVKLHGFLERNRSSAEQNRISELRAAAGSRGGKARWKAEA